ncbi:MAG: hypothetical protein D6775_02495 [Caldilineae bacterium]|nr:MAG: hypothetical protein D6775_02495 [Caldilineae bacterium]
MDEHTTTQPSEEEFSWERWIWQGLQAFRRTLFRYDFGLPEEFWRHLENAAHELLAAGRILLRALLFRRRRPSPPPEERGAIEIEWED